MLTLFASCTAAYAVIAVLAVYSLRRTRVVDEPVTAPGEAYPFVSILVAARNEAETLPACLESLLAQDYPGGRFEVIVIDDHSLDDTKEVASRYPVHCVRAPDTGPAGKAGALHAGITEARGDVLVITDADCRPPAGWMRRLTDQLRDGRIGIVCGVTSVSGGSFMAGVQGLDWTLLLGIAAGFSEMGIPVTAMGNNMCLRREAYEAVGGYPGLRASVTEDYELFRAIHRRTSFGARLILHRDLRNLTLPVSTWKEVLRQRKRWLRGGLRAGASTYAIYVIVFLAHLAPPVLLATAPAAALALLALKWTADALVIRTASRRLGVSVEWRAFLPFELYMTGYIILLPFMLALSPGVLWKGRRH